MIIIRAAFASQKQAIRASLTLILRTRLRLAYGGLLRRHYYPCRKNLVEFIHLIKQIELSFYIILIKLTIKKNFFIHFLISKIMTTNKKRFIIKSL